MDTTVAVRGLGITEVFGDVVALGRVGLNVARGPAAPGGVSGFADGPGPHPTPTAKQNLATLAKLRHRDAPMASIGEVLCRTRCGSSTAMSICFLLTEGITRCK